MFRQGVTKRGETISPGSKNYPSHHHSAVHSILHGKNNAKDDAASSSGRSSSRGSSPKKLNKKKSRKNSTGSGGTSGDSATSYNRQNSADSVGENSDTSLTLGSDNSWRKRSSSSPQKSSSSSSTNNRPHQVVERGGGDGGRQQFPPPPRSLSGSFTSGGKRSYSFDVGKQTMMKSKSFNNAGDRPISRGEASEPPGISPNSSPNINNNIIDEDTKKSLRRRPVDIPVRPDPPQSDRLSKSDSDRQIVQQYDEESESKLRLRSLSPSKTLISTAASTLTRGRSRGRMRDKAVKDMEEIDERFVDQQSPQQQHQQRGREGSLSRLGSASKLLRRGRSGARKRGNRDENSSPDKAVASPPRPLERDPVVGGEEEDGGGTQHDQASLMAVQVQPPSSPSYSPLVSMPKKGSWRSNAETQSLLSGDPLSHYDESMTSGSSTSSSSLGLKKKKSRRKILQSSLMKQIKRGSSLSRFSKSKNKDTPLDATQVDGTSSPDHSGTDRSGTNSTAPLSNASSQGSSYTNITVYEDGSVASSSLHRQSSTGTASTTVSSMLPPNHNPHSPNNLEWNPAMSLLNKMSALQRIESFSGEEDSDYTESQHANDDLEMEEIFYDADEVYESCSHSLFQKQMKHDEELDLSVVSEDRNISSKYKGKFMYRKKKSIDNVVGGLFRKKDHDSSAASLESDIRDFNKDKTKKRRSRSLSLRRIISRGDDEKEKEQQRVEALHHAMLESQQYQELKKQQQLQEAEENEYRQNMLQRSMSVDTHRNQSRTDSDGEGQFRRSSSLPRNTDIAHNHALAAIATEAGRRHRDSTRSSNERRIVRRDSKDPTGRRASFESENSSLRSSTSSHASRSSRASSSASRSARSHSRSQSRSHSRHKKKKKKKQAKHNCLICHQQVSSGNKMVDFMEFHFCVDCFRCAGCRRALGELDAEDPTLSGAQVISNARGSIVQCGACVMQLGRARVETSSPISSPTVTSSVPTKREVSVNYCALCKSGFTGYKGEVQCIGVNKFHSECLRREKGLVSSIGSRSLGSDGISDVVGHITPTSSIAGDELTPAGAAQNVSEKAIVRITLADNDGDIESNHLSNVFFVWPNKEDDLAEIEASEQDMKMEKFLRNNGQEVDLSVQVKYQLDMLKHQHNQFLTLPHLESDVDGRITDKFQISLHFSGVDTNLSAAVPQPSGPALLSIEPFPREKDSAKKVLRATWSYECDGIQHEFRFIAPFNSPYGVAWEIFEGDELDFTSCKLECFIDKMYNADISDRSSSKSTPRQRRRKSSRTSSGSACDWELRADELLDEMEDDKKVKAPKRASSKEEDSNPIDTSLKSLDKSGKGSLDKSSKSVSSTRTSEYSDGGGMLILHRKSRHVDPDREENDHFSELLSVASSSEAHSITLPTIIHVAVDKKSDDEIGLSLIEKNGSTVVSEVSKSGLFQSKLAEGCEILSVNGHKVRSPRSFIRMMKDVRGQIFVMASSSPSPPGAKFIVVKKSTLGYEEEEQGISFQKVNGVLRVQSIKETGVFAESNIGEGDLCLSIDGVPAISENVAMRSLTRAHGNVALLVFPMANFWKSVVELTIDDKYDRWWKSRSECVLFLDSDSSHPVNLSFDEETGLCAIQDNTGSDVNVKTMNTIISRVMKVLKESIQSYITAPKKKRDTSRSLSVSPSGKLQNRSDVYKRALVKLDEMRESGRLSDADYASAKRALTEVAINTTNS
jgi:hypothetical protein